MHISSDSIIVLEVILLIIASAICSGLNIALMSLETSDLKRKAKLKNKAAIRILPLRQNSHLTLASILLTNVAAVSATSLVLEQRLTGWLAGLVATLLIVVLVKLCRKRCSPVTRWLGVTPFGQY